MSCFLKSLQTLDHNHLLKTYQQMTLALNLKNKSCKNTFEIYNNESAICNNKFSSL